MGKITFSLNLSFIFVYPIHACSSQGKKDRNDGTDNADGDDKDGTKTRLLRMESVVEDDGIGSIIDSFTVERSDDNRKRKWNGNGCSFNDVRSN